MFVPLAAASQENPRTAYTAYYNAIVGHNDQLVYNGIQFEDVYRSNQEHFRYFDTPKYTKGAIFYNGQDYYDINMKYDLVEDQVIIMSSGPLQFFDVQLIQEKVRDFTLKNRHFVFYEADEGLEKGFYEEAYKDQDVTFLVKYSKLPSKKNGKHYTYFIFNDSESFFIRKDGATAEFNSLRALKKILKEDAELIEAYSNAHPPRGGGDFRSYLLGLFSYLHKNR